MKTEGAFFNDTMGPGREWPLPPNVSIRRQIVTVIFFFFLFFTIETSCPVGAGDNTIFTSETSSEILYNNPVFTAIRCLGRTYGHTWGMITMHTWHWDEFRIHLGIFPVGHSDDLIPKNISSRSLLIRRTMWNVVLRLTS